MKVHCIICNVNFDTRPAAVEVGNGKFCSRKCYGKYKSTIMMGIKNSMFGVHRYGDKSPRWKGGKPDCLDCGKKLSVYYVRRCKSCSHKLLVKEKSNKWKGGLTPLKIMIRNTRHYDNWRFSIFKRDNFQCQECFKYSKSDINAHHIKQFSLLIKDFLSEYSQFSPVEDKETLTRLSESYKPFWDIDNGVTLCEGCHSLKEIAR